MSGPMRSPSAFDETLLLAEAVERTVSHGDELSSLPVLVLAELPGLVKLARRVEASAQAIGPSDAFRAAARGRLMASMRETAALSAPQIRRPRRQP